MNLNREGGNTFANHKTCHPEVRVLCGPKDLCTFWHLMWRRQDAQILRSAQDDKDEWNLWFATNAGSLVTSVTTLSLPGPTKRD